ncbi:MULTISPECIES: sigma-70 family RNA polymerase sigma factor [unclassified Spirosoma]|uniref:RNA polymerase sigma factor n=1 Tax=unclassified Spirosoma TaxID=2621999 RepID=UPI0009670911|nr:MULTISPECIES: sigma-70 family RNA polymerase sigma factor [unclassified Spirosoma]MBN8822074.1 sigma-70 family RNA polymerase sigma factor [Spirosoma sp.]OJW80477.1 MAG: RNA polymerase subunit sigma-24 [Spirosoma sp. 48-14]
MLFKRSSKSLDLTSVIQGCRHNRQSAQRQLYEAYYGLAKNICMRYASSQEEAEEMTDDGFVRIFNKITYYDPEQPFEAWFRTVMVHTAIDYFRRFQSRMTITDLKVAFDVPYEDGLLEKMSADEIMELVQRLPPAYRAVFSLSVIDGYTHPEIARMLGIQESTSRSNLLKARLKLQEWMGNRLSNEPSLCLTNSLIND